MIRAGNLRDVERLGARKVLEVESAVSASVSHGLAFRTTLDEAAGVQIQNYLVVHPVEFRSLENGKFASESAYAEHLRLLLDTLIPTARMRLLCPEMSEAQYRSNRDYYAIIDSNSERIEYIPLYPADVTVAGFWMRWPKILAKIREQVSWADVVHSGTSHQVTRPFEFACLREALRQGKKTVAVMDIDLRREAAMNYEVGNGTYRALLTNRWFHDPLRIAQLNYVARHCSLVMFKGREMVEDFGKGRPAVKNILDAAHSADNIISADKLEEKRRRILDVDHPLELVYFGRLVPYKGVDRMIRAVRQAIDGGANVRLEVVGPGPQRSELEALARQLGLQQSVSFRGPVQFGAPLFNLIYEKHLLLAAPLTEDTPRSALDALAAGVPIIAFDTQYYKSLQDSGAVVLCKWPNAESMAERILELVNDRARVAKMLEPACAFARDNTQQKWLERRAAWTREFVGETA